MTPSPATEENNSAQSRSAAKRVSVWLALQLIPLALAAARAPLWAKFPNMGETMAGSYLLAVQLFASALLFPWLMCDLRTSALVVLSAVPMLLLASALGGDGAVAGMVGVGIAVSWLVALAIWSPLLRRLHLELLGPPLLTAILLAVPLLWYLRAE